MPILFGWLMFASSMSGTQVGRKLADAELVVLIQMVSNPDKSVDL